MISPGPIPMPFHGADPQSAPFFYTPQSEDYALGGAAIGLGYRVNPVKRRGIG